MLRSLFASAIVAAMPATGFAFGIRLTNGNSGNIVKWTSTTVPYQIDADGPDNITDGSDMAAARRAVASWNDIACSAVTLLEQGTTTSTDVLATQNVTDGTNRLAWIEDSRWQWGQYVLGITTPVFSSDGAIDEADIAFNGYLVTWSVNSSSFSTVDVESVVAHELGHFIGLQHVINGTNSVDPPTMSPLVDPYLKSQSLSTDDRSGACYLYPVSSYVCGSTCDCPAIVDQHTNGQEFNAGRMQCVGGSCSGLATDSNAPGATCAGNACASGLRCPPTQHDTGDDTGFACECDLGGDCDETCDCDPECAYCACDATTACDADPTGRFEGCPCDPECAGGCAIVAPQLLSTKGSSGWTLAVLLVLAGQLVSRRRRG